MSIYKSCDIRGEFGSQLQLRHAVRLGEALVALKGPSKLLVGGDGRASTPALKSALVESLVRAGCSVVDLGMVPTPLFYFARWRLGIEMGVMVTASHNPPQDNGFKITPGPLPITVEEMKALAEWMESEQTCPPVQNGGITRLDLLADYLDFLAGHTPDLSGLKVVVDCANGMAGLVARPVWQKSGAQVTYLLEEVDGNFPAHSPNPAESKNLALLQETVRQQGADLGIAYDGDADRVAFVDELGQPVVSDKVIVIFAREVLRGTPETIIYDQKCSRIVPDTIRRLNGTPLMELSGHTYIKRLFLERRAAYAGELSGHHFFRSLHGDDAPGASLLFARILKESGQPLSRLVAEIPSYPITPDIRLPMPASEVKQLIHDLETALSDRASLSRTDGLRVETDYGWGLVRPSVTEPVVTLRFEGVDEAGLKKIMLLVEEASPYLQGKLVV